MVLPVNSQEIKVKPEKAGLSSERLNRIQPFMQKYIDKNQIPGMITLAARHGKIVHFETYGVMNAGKPMLPNTIFRIASMTKPVICVAAMMLYEEGHFQLDDPAEELILIQMAQFTPSFYYPVNKEFKVLVYQSIID